VSKRRTPFAVAAVIAAVAVAGCGGASDSSGGGAATASSGPTLALVAYSTPQGVYDQLIPAFAKTSAGRGVRFNESFGASGEQSRAVASGQPADVVAFSLAPDVDKLVKAGLVAGDWTAAPHRGFVSDSVAVLMVRKGNPKHIETWADLLRPGVQVLTPNPFTSGGAKWNLLAAYGAQLKEGRSPAEALAYVRTLLTQHVKVQDKSGRESVQDFLGGNGDVAISYENEAITAQQKGAKVDYVIPRDTILIENPVALTKAAKPQAKSFLSYLWTAPAQQAFAKHGYRPVDTAVFKQYASRFPTPAGLFTISYLGGWSAVNKSIVDPQSGSVAKIEQDAGVSTGH
jgi:sulfate/thiosulfate transport system substrate-binding protein